MQSASLGHPVSFNTTVGVRGGAFEAEILKDLGVH